MEEANKAIQEEAAERRRAEDALREQREWFRVTLSSISDAVIATDAQGRVAFLNPVAESLTGWPAEEAVGKPLHEIFRAVNEQTRERVASPLAAVLRAGPVVGLGSLLIARDGTERPIEDSVAPIRDERGDVAGAVVVFRDVTVRRRAEQALWRLAAIVESSDDAIIGGDLAGIIESWNAAAERLYGYTAEEVLGKPVSLLIPPDRPNELPAILERLKRGEQVGHYETVRVRKDGRRVAVSVRISPIRDAAGTFVGASAIARDLANRGEAHRPAGV